MVFHVSLGKRRAMFGCTYIRIETGARIPRPATSLDAIRNWSNLPRVPEGQLSVCPIDLRVVCSYAGSVCGLYEGIAHLGESNGRLGCHALVRLNCSNCG